jgi:hypothetical protein
MIVLQKLECLAQAPWPKAELVYLSMADPTAVYGPFLLCTILSKQ